MPGSAASAAPTAPTAPSAFPFSAAGAVLAAARAQSDSAGGAARAGRGGGARPGGAGGGRAAHGSSVSGWGAGPHGGVPDPLGGRAAARLDGASGDLRKRRAASSGGACWPLSPNAPLPLPWPRARPAATAAAGGTE